MSRYPLQSIILGSLLFGPLFLQSACAADWYVDGLFGNDANKGTKAAPFFHVWKGLQVARPGDTVHLLPTIVYPPFGVIDQAGTASAPITIEGDGVAPHLTRVNGDGANFAIQVNSSSKNTSSSYIDILNFDTEAPGPWYGIYVGDHCHHVVISGNRIHDSGVGGINTTHADYVTISHNIVYSNSRYTATGYFGSGISTYENNDIDANTGVKMIIDSNTIYGNTNVPNVTGGQDSDGSGIILDDLRHTQSDRVAYKGRTLVENNVVYRNGGRGIDIFHSDHITAVNNTVYHNNRDPHESSWRPGEIMADTSGDIQIYNNIVYSNGSHCPDNCHVALSIESGSGLPIASDYALGYNSKNNSNLEYYLGSDAGHHNTNVITIGSHNLWADPLFVDAAKHDFQLQSSSPGRGSANPSVAPSVDILGHSRPPHGPTDIGAYQQ
jgi:parallel beta-helix repeat protein